MLAWQEGLLDGLTAIAAVVYAIVAYVQWRRPVSSGARPARNGFVLWWAGIAFIGLFGLFAGRVLDLESWSLAGYRVLLYTFIPIIFVALAGLVYYLLYLYTGKSTLLRYVVAFYVLLTVAFVVFVEAQDPFVGPDPDTGEVGLQYANEAPAWASLLFSLALLLPPFAAAVAYFGLVFRAKDRTLRYRILMVSGGFMLWMGFSLLSSLGRFASGAEEQGFLSQLVGQLLGLLSAALVLLAYYPPPIVRRALDIEHLKEQPADDDRPEPFQPAKRMNPVVDRFVDLDEGLEVRGGPFQYSATATPSRSTNLTVPGGGA